MLIATRDPDPDRGTNAPPVSHQDTRVHSPVKAPHSTRFVTALQMTGSVLAIPVALGSAYSVYQTNFSPDVACQNLRAGIVAMIDKQMDAGTRRMLVRRDVEAFQKSCASFDPDATAAFANLLASPRPAAKAATPKAEAKAEAPKETFKEASKPAPKAEASKAEKAEAKTETAKAEHAKTEPVKEAAPRAETAKAEPVKEAAPKAETAKSEPRPQAVAKQAAPAAEAEVNSDARWLDAVRHALVARAESGAAAVGAPARSLGSLVMPAPGAPAAALAPAAASPTPAEAAAAAPAMAPVLPPATAVPEPAPAAITASDPDRPVPPAEIPAVERKPSTWISSIPFVGQVLDR